jgi:hypothetical protein
MTEIAINVEKDDPELHTLLVNWCNNPKIRNKDLIYYHGIVYNMAKIRPNQPCQCGSGRKYKKCCG